MYQYYLAVHVVYWFYISQDVEDDDTDISESHSQQFHRAYTRSQATVTTKSKNLLIGPAETARK